MSCRDMNVAAARVTILDRSTSSYLKSADLYLADLTEDSENVLDAVRLRTPFVALADLEQRPNNPTTWASCLLAARLVERSTDAFVETAVRLASDESLREKRRQEASQVLAAAKSRVEPDVAQEVNRVLFQLAGDAGLSQPNANQSLGRL